MTRVVHHAVAGINAHVPSGVAEEHQVAGLRAADWGSCGLLGGRSARQRDAHLGEDVRGVTGAVETGRRTSTAPGVGVTGVGRCNAEDTDAGSRGRLRRRGLRSGGGLRAGVDGSAVSGAVRTLSRLAEVSVRTSTAAAAWDSGAAGASAAVAASAAGSATRVTAVKPLVPKSRPSTSSGAVMARAGLSEAMAFSESRLASTRRCRLSAGTAEGSCTNETGSWPASGIAVALTAVPASRPVDVAAIAAERVRLWWPY